MSSERMIRVRECELIQKGPEHTLAEEETGGRVIAKEMKAKNKHNRGRYVVAALGRSGSALLR
jgi:hypothetical protein